MGYPTRREPTPTSQVRLPFFSRYRFPPGRRKDPGPRFGPCELAEGIFCRPRVCVCVGGESPEGGGGLGEGCSMGWDGMGMGWEWEWGGRKAGVGPAG